MPKKAIEIEKKTYKNRFGNYAHGVCPYCGATGATLTPIQGRYVGECPACKAMNNFTRKECKVWAEEGI